MRPLLPQSKFNFPVLFKLLVIYGVVALIVLLCAVVVEFVVVSGFGYYRFEFQLFGVTGLIGLLIEDFVGMDSSFMRTIRQTPLQTLLIPFGAGGILGVIHYIYVRRRRSDIQKIEESLESEVDLK